MAALAATMLCGAANATEYFTSFAGSNGPDSNASIWFTASDSVNRLGGYDITSVRGFIGNDAATGDRITGLIANPTPSYKSYTQDGAFSYDNVLFGTGPLLGNDGALFTTASGLTYNLWAQGAIPLQYDLERATPTAGGGFNYVHSLGNLTTPTPPPPPPVATPNHPTVVDFEDSRTYLPDITQSQGFKFLSDGHCCNYVNQRGNTNRTVFTLFDLVMSAVDGSAFNVSSLDMGPDAYASLSKDYLVLLNGTKSDGHTISTTLDVLGGMKTYQLAGFDDLTLLRIVHPTGGNEYFALDNVAVSPSAAVPEPASWSMMIVGFGAVGAAMRRRKVATGFA